MLLKLRPFEILTTLAPFLKMRLMFSAYLATKKVMQTILCKKKTASHKKPSIEVLAESVHF